MISEDLGGGSRGELADFFFNGVQYITLTERLVAEMLTNQRVPFTPDVKIVLGLRGTPEHPKPPQPIVYVPDFIFDKREWLWTWMTGETEIVHGIECKGRTYKASHKRSNIRKVRLLREERGINLIVLSEEETLLLQEFGGLPLTPL